MDRKTLFEVFKDQWSGQMQPQLAITVETADDMGETFDVYKR